MFEERRMPRFKNMIFQDPPENIEKWYENEKYTYDKFTVYKLRNLFDIDEEDRKLFYNDLNNRLSKSEKNESNKLLNRIRNEYKVEILESIYDSDEHRELKIEIVKRMIDLDKNIYRKYLNQLTGKYTENAFDRICSILIETMRTKDIFEEILEILKKDIIRDPSDFASLVQIIGLSNRDNLKYLYSFYRYFINNFTNENYFEGPLFGISYYIKRRRTNAST